MVELVNGTYNLFGMVKTPGDVHITPKQVEDLVRDVGYDMKINCIKEARIRWGLGLRDAKLLIETVIRIRKTFTQIVERTVFAYDEAEAWNISLPSDLRSEDITIVSIREGY